MKSHSIFRFIFLAVIAAALISCASSQGTGRAQVEVSPDNPDRIAAQQLTEKAHFAFQNFMNDSNMGAMRDTLKNAKGIFIMPSQLKAAFIFGASGGNGVFLARDTDNNWKGPAFFSVGGASFGLQAGAQSAEVVLLVMTDRGVAAFQSNNFKLGVDAGVAAGPMGIGLAAQTANISADILSYSRAKGLYGGVSLEGAVVAARGALAKAYYGRDVSTSDVLIRGTVEPSEAKRLIAALDRSSRASRETGTTEQRKK